MKTKNSSSQFFLGVIGLASLAVIGASAILVSTLLQTKNEPVAPNAADEASADYSASTCLMDFTSKGISTPTPTPCQITSKKAEVALVLDISGSMMRKKVRDPNDPNSVIRLERIPKIDNAVAASQMFATALLKPSPDPIAGKVKMGMSVFSTCKSGDDDPHNPVYDKYVWPITATRVAMTTSQSTMMTGLNNIMGQTVPKPFVPVGPKDTPADVPPRQSLEDANYFRTCTHEGIILGDNQLMGTPQSADLKKYLVIMSDGRPYADDIETKIMIQKAISAAVSAASRGQMIITIGLGQLDMPGDVNDNNGLIEGVMKCMAGTIPTFSWGGINNDCLPGRPVKGQYYYAKESADLAGLFEEIYQDIANDICVPISNTSSIFVDSKLKK